MGSVAALSSVSTITAALLGHVLLGEALGWFLILALLLGVGGAVLTWDPETISASDTRVLGNILALLAGISSACGTVCARKAGKVSSLMLGSLCIGQNMPRPKGQWNMFCDCEDLEILIEYIECV